MTLLKNQYRLLKELGGGAFGKTYLAEDTHSPSRRRCVVKQLIWNYNPQLADDVRERFRREALLLESLGRGSQGGIPELYAYFTEGEHHYLVQEWIDGETLTQKLSREGPQAEGAVIRMLLGVLRILDYIHTRPTPIIHRDIKPDNVMLRQGSEQVVLIDFGVVKEVTQIEGSTILVGTSGYMPPEQVAGRPTLASDIYALGMTAITYATDRYPRSMVDVQSGELRWRGLASHLSPALADILEKAIRTDHRERFQSARAFAMAICTAFPQYSAANAWLCANTNPTLPAISWMATPPVTTQPEVVHSGSTSAPTVPAFWPPAPSDPSVSPSHPASSSTGQSSREGTFRANTRLFLPLAGLGLVLVLLTSTGLLLWWKLQPTVDSKLSPDAPKTPQPPSIAIPEGMVLIRGGVFQMGSQRTEEPAEFPAHEVVVKPFLLDKYEVTNAAYAAFVKSTGHPAPPDWKNGTYPGGKANHPVANISWDDARAYAAWAGKRLPTEVEWEFAARGTEGRQYPWGNEFDRWRLNSVESKVGHTEAVGSFPTGATPEGVLDLAGNVAEWTASDDTPYPGSKYKPEPGAKIVRGGGFSLSRKYASATKRTQVPPDTRDPALGFRCAKDVESSAK